MEVNYVQKPRFEWDENKNTINKRKHKVSFEEAKTVFLDYNALYMPDPEHSETEERFVILGMSTKANLLIVCHCYRESDSVIRLISARKATTREEQQYLEG
jgi:hypothetical protein